MIQQNEKNELSFDFEGHDVRVVGTPDEPWWIAADVCEVLEIANSRDAVSRLDDDERDDVGITDAIGRVQETTVINESGLYSLIFTSRKEAAKRFKKWVTSEVLPSIRKTGSYTMTHADQQSLALVPQLVEQVKGLAASNHELVAITQEANWKASQQLAVIDTKVDEFSAVIGCKIATTKTRRIHAEVVNKHRGGLCPCCEEFTITEGEELVSTARVMRPYYRTLNGPEHTVPVCGHCFNRHTSKNLLQHHPERVTTYTKLVVEHLGRQQELEFTN